MVNIKKENSQLNDDDSIHNEQSMQSIGKDPLRILVVEDDSGSREIAVKIFISEGYLVKSSENGFQAIDIFNHWHPHLIILDVKLPGLDGFEVVKNIRSTHEGEMVPIIMISGNMDEEIRSMAFESGVNEYIPKPYDFDDLLKCVTEQLKIY